MRKINWFRFYASMLWIVIALCIPIAIWSFGSDILFSLGWRFLRSDGVELLSPGGVVLTAFTGAVGAIPLGVTLAHLFNADWDFFDAVERVFPAKTTSETTDPKQSDWR